FLTQLPAQAAILCFQLPDALLLPVLSADLAHLNAGGFQPAAQRVDADPQLFGHFHRLTALFCHQPHGSGFERIVVPWGCGSLFHFLLFHSVCSFAFQFTTLFSVCQFGYGGTTYHYYKCGKAKRRGQAHCSLKAIRKEPLERFVVDTAVELVLNDPVIEHLTDLILEAQGRENTRIPVLKEQLQDTEKRLSNLLEAIEQSILTPTTKQRLNELETRRDA